MPLPLVHLARNIAGVLDVGVVSDLDPQSLHRQCDVAPGMYNAALWILANDGRGASQSLRDELDETGASTGLDDHRGGLSRARSTASCETRRCILDEPAGRSAPVQRISGISPRPVPAQTVDHRYRSARHGEDATGRERRDQRLARRRYGTRRVDEQRRRERDRGGRVECGNSPRPWKIRSGTRRGSGNGIGRLTSTSHPGSSNAGTQRVRRTWFFRGTRTRRLLTAVTGEHSDTSLGDLARWAALDQTRTALMEKLSETEGRIGDPDASLRRADAPDPHQPIVLDEHYRCHPHIARWFNRVFYDGSLTVLTDVARMPSNERRIGWIDVRGEVRRGGAGSWTNIAEAEVAVRQIAAMVRHAGRSVGVVTPFSAQAALIQRLARPRRATW